MFHCGGATVRWCERDGSYLPLTAHVVVALEIDAIQNAANRSLLGGGGSTAWSMDSAAAGMRVDGA